MIDEKCAVRARYPQVVARSVDIPDTYYPWLIEPWPLSLLPIGGGPTEAEAWHNAWVHIDVAERGKARRQDGSEEGER